MYSFRKITNYSFKENLHSNKKIIFPQDEHAEAKPWEEELGARRHPNPTCRHLCSVEGSSAARCACKLPKEAEGFGLPLCDGQPWTTPRVQSRPCAGSKWVCKIISAQNITFVILQLLQRTRSASQVRLTWILWLLASGTLQSLGGKKGAWN